MKESLFVAFLAGLSMLLLASCNLNESAIQTRVARDRKTCPLDMGNGLTLKNVEYNGLYITYLFEGDPERHVFTPEMSTPLMKKQMISSLQAQAAANDNMENFLNALKANHVGIVYHYSVPDSDSAMDIIIDSTDL